MAAQDMEHSEAESAAAVVEADRKARSDDGSASQTSKQQPLTLVEPDVIPAIKSKRISRRLSATTQGWGTIPLGNSISGSMPGSLRTRKSYSSASSKLQPGDPGFGLRSIKVSPPSQREYPTPFAVQEDEQDGANVETVNQPQQRGISQPQVSMHHHHHMPYPQHGYVLYSVPSTGIAYAMADPNASPHGSPSPLMGSPVGTPTAMMFPQTPFAGASTSPFYGDGRLSPHASGRVSYFHPFFSHFPFANLQSMASVQQQQNSIRPRSSLSQGPRASVTYARQHAQQQMQHRQQASAPGAAPSPAHDAGHAGGGAGGDNNNNNAGNPNGSEQRQSMPGGPTPASQPAAPPRPIGPPGYEQYAQLKAPLPSVLFSVPSYISMSMSMQPPMNMPPHPEEASNDANNKGGQQQHQNQHQQHQNQQHHQQQHQQQAQQAFMDPALLGMIQAIQMHPYSPHGGGMYMPMDPAQLQMLAHQIGLAGGPVSSPQVTPTAASTAGSAAFPINDPAAYAMLFQPGSPAGMAGPMPTSPMWAGNVMNTGGGPGSGGSGGIAGLMGGAGSMNLSSAGPSLDMWELAAMYNGLAGGVGNAGMPFGLGQAGLLPGQPDLFMAAGMPYAAGLQDMAMRGQDHGFQNKMRMGRGPPNMGGFPSNLGNLSNMNNYAAFGMMGGGLPHIITHQGGSPTGFGRRGPNGSPITPPQQQNRPRRPNANDTSAIKIGPDGLPRLNARQRRTLRRAKERAIKGLMEAGRLLLQRAETGGGGGGAQASTGSTGGAVDDEKSGSDAEGDKGESGAAAVADLAATKEYFQAAMQVAGGSHGPQAAADASQVLSKVAAELEDMDMAQLITQLNTRKEEGTVGVDEGLIRDLQIIQNLMGALRSPALNNVVGAADLGSGGGAAGSGAGAAALPLRAHAHVVM